MIDTQALNAVLAAGGNIIGPDGAKVGTVEQVYLDDETGRPEWVTVRTGFFGTSESFVPVGDAHTSGTDLVVAYDSEVIKNAPRLDDTEGHLSREQEAELYRHYDLVYTTGHDAHGHDIAPDDDVDDLAVTGIPMSAGIGHVLGRYGTSPGDDTAGATTHDPMTRPEGQLHVVTDQLATGKPRLRRYVVPENVTPAMPGRSEDE